MVRVVHLSDLHFGRHDPEVVEGLASDITEQRPNLIIVSGDFTQNGTKSEFAAARQFLDTLQAPVFAVPGNHDVPQVNLLSRLIRPYRLYKRYISPDLEPFMDLGTVAIAGLRTVRRARAEFNWAHGTISRDQLNALDGRFEAASPTAIRVVVAHHPLLFPDQPMVKKMRRVKRADVALERFSELGVRLVLSGHFHMSYVRRHEHHGEIGEAIPVGPRQSAAAPILVCQASSTTSTRLRGHLNGYNVIDFQPDGHIDISVREWTDDDVWRTRESSHEQMRLPQGEEI
jgi:3',5'-cyclic AMP phosphodiesterase CpdA